MPAKRFWTVLLVLVLLTANVSGLAAHPARSTDARPLDPVELTVFFEGLMSAQLAGARIPGATVTVVADGEILLAEGYGYADLARQIRVDGARTLFRPGSISKLFTWTAVMQLVEQGRLDLNADINTYLDFEIPATYPEPITLYHLMAHTPGFEDQGMGLFLRDAADLPPLDEFLRANVPARVFAPGAVGAYSNYGSTLAGYIVERVSGEPFEVYIENHIFEPLGMEHSTFHQPLPEALAPAMANGYAYSRGTFIHGGFEVVGAPPAGALSATSEDMARFMIAHLQEGRYGDARILAADTAQEMHRQHHTADPRVSGMAHGFMEQTVNGRRIIYHGGDTFLFHSALYLIPEENVGLYVSYNSAGAAGNTVREDLLRAFMDRYFPGAEAPEPEPPADFAERAARYVGEYHMARANFSTPEKLIVLLQALQVTATPDNHLVVSFGGQSQTYVEIALDVFQNVLDLDTRITFFSLDNGDLAVQMEGLSPLAFVKAPFHATTGFHLLLLLGSLLLALSVLIGWPIAFINRRGKLYGERWLPRIARFVGAGFALLTLVFIIGFFAVFGDLDPAYGVPNIFFGLTPTFLALNRLLPVVLILGVGVVIFAALAWIGVGNRGKPYWRLGGRVHYTALAIAAAAVLWLLSFWRLWGGM